MSQKRSWREALAIAWLPAEDWSLRDAFGGGFAALFFGYAFVAIFLAAPIRAWFGSGLLGMIELGWYIGWARWTKPRLPTIWEAFAGQLITLALPVVNAVRWFSEFKEDHEKKS